MGKTKKSDWWKCGVLVIGVVVVSQLPESWRPYIAIIFGIYVLSMVAQFFEGMNDKLDEIIDLLNAQYPRRDSFD